ncbi:hypothetical protein BVRB_9g219150 [Beta vulgaris subsp. vulgaris]|nr:hypothetical protein BVRB_9g219150 [Beta vulgaris subsp. vulgaris]
MEKLWIIYGYNINVLYCYNLCDNCQHSVPFQVPEYVMTILVVPTSEIM